MDEETLQDAITVADYVNDPDTDLYWVTPTHHDASLAELTTLPEQYQAECDRVLDVGCGDGTLTAEIAKSYDDTAVYGVDLVHRYAQVAVADYANATVFGGDAEALLAELEPFDLVYCVNTLQEFPDFEDAAATIADSVADGGYLAVTTTGDNVRDLFADQIVEPQDGLDYWEFKDITFDEGVEGSFSQTLIPEDTAISTFEEYGLEIVEQRQITADDSSLDNIMTLLDQEPPQGGDEPPSYPFLVFKKTGDAPC